MLPQTFSVVSIIFANGSNEQYWIWYSTRIKMYHSNEFLLHVYEKTVNKTRVSNKKKYRLLLFVNILYDIDYTMW